MEFAVEYIGSERFGQSLDIIKSYLTRVCEKKIRNGYITLETRAVIQQMSFQFGSVEFW